MAIDRGAGHSCRRIAALLLGLCALGSAAAAQGPKCLFVSSYHRGYEWSDGVERGLRAVLEGRCELRQVDMDTKRLKGEDQIERRAVEIRDLIESWRPDVVITADDHAAKYVVQRYFRDAEVPIVFCGVNWTAEEYGFPYRNVTGMVEVAPIRPMLERAAEISPPGRHAYYIGAETLTERKNLQRFADAASELGVRLEARLVGSTAQWIAAYREAQQADYIVLGSNSGIGDWDEASIREAIRANSRRLTVTNHGWMMPFAMFGMTKVPEEHGEWSAHTALAILGGVKPADIPIVANRKWDLWANESLLARSEVSLPRGLMHRAKRVR